MNPLVRLQILFSTGVHLNGHTFQSGVLRNVLAYGVSCFHAVEMRVESFDDFSAHFIAEFCCSDDDALNSYSIDVFCLSRISALRNDHLGVVWIFLHQLIRNLRIDINDSSRFVSSKVLYGCCREACYNDACINVAILQSIDCFAEGEVLYINIIVCDSISFLIPLSWVVTN